MAYFCLIGASLSEPHIYRRERRARFLLLYSTSVTRAPPYTKPMSRMKYLAMISPRQKHSIADHVDVDLARKYSHAALQAADHVDVQDRSSKK